MSEYELGNRGDNENELRTVFNQDFHISTLLICK